MKLSSQGEQLIKSFEGLRLTAYRDVAGVWTIGYGSTHYHDGRPVKPGDKLTNAVQASAIFTNTLGQYEDAVNSNVKVPLTQSQFDALVSFTYNTGIFALKESTLPRKLNTKDYAGAADQFLVWNKITDPKTGRKVACDTLTGRRSAERRLFLSTPSSYDNHRTPRTQRHHHQKSAGNHLQHRQHRSLGNDLLPAIKKRHPGHQAKPGNPKPGV